MIFEKGGKLYRRYDKELLCLEPYGKNGLRVRATQLSEFSDERLSALIEPEEKAENAKVWVDGKTGYIENGKILCKVLRTGKMKFYDRHGKLLLEDYEKNRFRENDPEEKDSALEIAPRTFTPHLGTNSYKLSVKFEAKEDEKFYGMGEYAHPYLNLKGCALELSQRNSQISVPFTLSSRGYGFLWNNPAVGKAIFGASYDREGEVVLADGTHINDIPTAIKHSIAYTSKDRDNESVVLNQSIGDNICLPSLDELANKAHILSDKKRREFADKYAKQMSVKMNDVNQFVSNLSGGNKQKVVLARWIGKDSDIVVLDSPTRGIDIKVKQDIYQLMNQMRKNGKSIIMISEELMELIGMSDRIIIMKDGKISGELERNQNLDENGLISMMV